MFKLERKMLTLIGLAGFIFFVGMPAWAQDFKGGDLFLGYSYASFDTALTGNSTTSGFSTNRTNTNGWAASFNANITKTFGFTADFGGHYGDLKVSGSGFNDRKAARLHVHEFLFGPSISGRTERVTGFGHFLLGAARVGNGNFQLGSITAPGAAETKFAMGIGGGIDLNLSKNIALRAVEVDYMPIRLGSDRRLRDLDITSGWWHNVRLKSGLVFRF